MKFLVAIVLLALAVAEATHVPEHTLRGPRFKQGHQYKYNVELNMTAGVLGLSSQVSASVLQAEVNIYAKTDKVHILKIENVQTSGSVPAIDNPDGDITLRRNRELEDRLSSPIKFVLEDGEIKSYTLSHKENLESRKIKKSILRSLEMYIPQETLRDMESPETPDSPYMYNTTEETEYGVHITNYIISVSPYVDFPAETAVYNISRMDNYEGEWYPGHKIHHNFQRQGCPEVCRQEWRDNECAAGCPNGYEPHHSPIRKSFTHEHSLSPIKGIMTPEVITTSELHYARMYDQDMEVLIRYRLEWIEVTNQNLEEESGQQTFTDLHDEEAEINEDEIDEICQYKKSEDAVQAITNLLETISTIIVEGELGVDETPLIGEKVILLRDVMTRLQVADFKTVARKIKTLKALEFASDKEKVQRQIWLDILPLVGTPESVKFIVRYILSEIKSNNMLTWEAKEILEALPQNIEKPDATTIEELKKLMENTELLRKSPLLHSAIYMCMVRTIAESCGIAPMFQAPKKQQAPWHPKHHYAPKARTEPAVCPEREISVIVEHITKRLSNTERPHEIALYIEAMSRLPLPEVLPVISEYVYGTADNIQKFSPRFIDFTKTIALHTLHNLAASYPEEVLEIVAPVFFNETESPKIRNAAFGVLMRCQPSLDILELVATRSWTEMSREVGSFVTSTLETYGNSSLPCMQLISKRIKVVFPHVKRFDVGIHYAKNYMWTYFDDLREFGLEGRFEFTPNNESYIPSTLYQSLSYSMESLRDVVFQNSLNIEGLTQERIFEKINDYLNIENIETIEREEEVFGEGKKGLDYIEPRTVDELRFTTFTKWFYKTSYNYYDYDILRSVIREYSAVFAAYLRKTETKYSGYLVKLYLPSSYHTISMAKTIPYPVEFQMRQPLILALRVRTSENTRLPPSRKHFDLHLEPSVYWSKLYTHQIKNIGDCKEIGVFHEQRIAVTYPFEIKYDGMTFPNVTIKYKVPPKEKRILSYYTESGTYAAKKELETLPSTSERSPIYTLPTPFKIEKDLHLVGVPPLHFALHTEDMNLFYEKMPSTPTEALDIIVRRVMNAGWRHKSVNITILEDHNLWSGDTEATFTIEYSRMHVPRLTRMMNAQDIHRHREFSTQPKRSSRWSTLPDDDDEDNYDDAPSWRGSVKQSEEDDNDESWSKQHSRNSRNDDDDDNSWPKQFSRQSEDDEDDDSSFSKRRFRRSDNDDDDEDWSRSKQYARSSTEDEDWSKYLKPHGIKTLSKFSKNAKAVSRILNYYLPHMSHVLNISVTAEPLTSVAYLMMEFNHTYEKDLYSVHVGAASERTRGENTYEIHWDHLVGFWNKPDELEYGKNYGEQEAGFLTAITLPSPNEPVCPWEKMEIAVMGDLKYESNRRILENELLDRADDEYFLPETHEQCLSDVKDGNPLSEDCIKAIREYALYNHLHMRILWNENMPRPVRQFAQLADAYFKHYFFEHMTLDAEDNNEKEVDIKMHYLDKFVDESVVDVAVKKPYETVTLRRVPTGVFQPMSSIYGIYETAVLEATNNTYPPTCVMTENYVNTYDLVEYPFTPKDCHYVLTTHCAKNKNFAIVVRGTKEIYIHVASSTLVLTPKSGRETYTIKYNGKDYQINDPIVFHERDEIYAYTEEYDRGHEHVKVVAKKAGIRVAYDGKTIKVQVSPRYKGELCGLCSEFDGEELREFRGMDRCLYRDPLNFAESAMVKREGRCTVENVPEDRKFCDYGTETNAWSRPSYNHESNEPELMRNIIVNRGNEVCFSVHPFPACQDDVDPTDVEQQRVGFHCLPKRDVTAKRMITEAKWRPLEELERKSVDYVQRIDVPKKC